MSAQPAGRYVPQTVAEISAALSPGDRERFEAELGAANRFTVGAVVDQWWPRAALTPAEVKDIDGGFAAVRSGRAVTVPAVDVLG
ncbi:MAG: hypothetical protein AUG49_18840 [Catenulispora sp. 13_1_20CM_3_70_7]|nr:MAG: hypothetical protein AUG49_18840 [Catenulispora sp. 13_1_20CM_3_70_7]